jgi:hypothetical protein
MRANPFVLRANQFAIDAQKLLASAARRGYAQNGQLTVFSTGLIF